ncbi:type II toxin-antitoxin system RelE/ParE family toxin [Flavobacterium arundinis]|uniref:type II toxin-antitoxin system RelE/ParE family toxin n=1 Tax=Flavobacterium arundinis TaxID=3139143 RepID=UPI0038B28F4A
MGLTVYWTQFAEDKLEDIFNYYAFKASTRIAENLVNNIVEITLDLDKNPLSGQIEENLSHRIQEFSYLYTRITRLYIG